MNKTKKQIYILLLVDYNENNSSVVVWWNDYLKVTWTIKLNQEKKEENLK